MDELYYWIALRHVLGIGNRNYKILIKHFKTPKNIFQADSHELENIQGINAPAIESIRNFKHNNAIDRELELIEKRGIHIITLRDPSYPEQLKNIYDPPPFIYIKGELKKKDNNAIAIVGSRNASEYGSILTEQISRQLSLKGITIVSGMARGIDSRAHYGALAAKGRTLAVLGSGIDVIYPLENKKLYDAIISHGAVISEFPMGTLPHAYNFPARNRIISGLSLGVLVVEASLKSGSLITARFALEQGKEVFAVPGSVLSHKSRGTHKLLKEGAKLVESAQDILEELHICPSGREDNNKHDEHKQNMTSHARMIYRLLNENPLHIDEVILRTQLTSGQVSSILLELELQGFIKQLPGKRFVKLSSRAQ